MKSIFTGNIGGMRAVEDAIRASRRYTEGIETLRTRHPAYPVQGEGFASRVFCKHYEVYPDMELTWDMPAGKAIDWLWGDVACTAVTFKYDYRTNEAEVTVKGGPAKVQELSDKIPGFADTLAMMLAAHTEPLLSAQSVAEPVGK